MVGQFALGFAVANPVILLSQLQLRPLQATDASHREYRPGDYLALRLVTTLLALAVIAALAVGSGYRRETALVVILAGVAKGFESISDVLYGHLQQHEKMATIARSMMLRGVLSVGVTTVAVWVTGSALWGAAALAGAWALTLAAHDVPSVKAVGRIPTGLQWDWTAMRRLAKAALPLGVVTMLASLDTNIPRYVIAHDLGEAPLGVFAAVASLQAAGSVLVNALGQTAAPRLARYHVAGDRMLFRSFLAKLLLIALVPGVAIIVVALAAGDAVPRVVFGPAFAHERTVFVWLSLSMAIWLVTSILGYGATASRRIQLQPYVLAAVAATTLVVSAFAVPRYGILGAAVGGTFSAALCCILYAALLLVPTARVEAPSI